MDYIGEHLLPGKLGHFFIVLSLVASLVATVAYFLSTTSKTADNATYWRKLARYAFITEVISVFAIFGILFYIIHHHLFEYKYAWQHSSLSLEFKYLLACFWEGQEGSFLLWSIWHCILGLIVIKTSKQWEAPVMTVVSFAQFALATMILGMYVFGHKIGSNPFILLRDSGVLDNAPALHLDFDVNQPLRPDYMASIKDGNDLNVLLQNYWMVIHPPVLFLGFASTLIPFAFAIAGLWTRKFGDWIKHALPWGLFAAATLGVGIMMGAMWAYESLTFGGYWAWDPVENASLVPWLILIAGIHTALIYKHSGHSLRATYLFFILTFGFILYSTFLTRSGILGDSSVHAFTDLGMNVQLYLLMFCFMWGGAIVAAKDFRQKLITGIAAIGMVIVIYCTTGIIIGLVALLIGLGFLIYQIQTQVPTIHKEESGSSREFWMFIGALVFFLSAIVIIGKTSLPVLNKVLESLHEWFPGVKMFDKKIAAPADAEFAYNSIQVYVAVIVALLTAITQYFKYKDTPTSFFWKKILTPTIIAVVIVGLALAFGNFNY
ncbi:MAG TPA: cytochrome c biogenesis protein CcsA, partial [Chitinophagaceae bacterium]